MSRDSTTVASMAEALAGDGSVRMTTGTYTAWIEVIDQSWST